MQTGQTKSKNPSPVAPGFEKPAEPVAGFQSGLRSQGLAVQQQSLRPPGPVQRKESTPGPSETEALPPEPAAEASEPQYDQSIPGMNGDPTNDAFIAEWWQWMQSAVGVKTYAEVSAEHLAFAKEIYDIIRAGIWETTTPYGAVWPNTCQWLLEKQFPLVALVRTHDSSQRVKKMNKAGMVARFSDSENIPLQGTYNKEDLTDSTNLTFESPGTMGWRRNDGLIAITEVGRASGPEAMRATLVHEVQHDADQHLMLPGDRYLSELRAYWIDGDQFSECSVASGSAKQGLKAGNHSLDGFDNERQQRIFIHLHASYDYVPQLWETQHGRDRILAAKQPTGLNMINSIRIDRVLHSMSALSDIQMMAAVEHLDPKMAEEFSSEKIEGKRQELDGHLANLSVSDKTALGSPEMRSEWESAIAAYFPEDAAFQELLKKQMGLVKG